MFDEIYLLAEGQLRAQGFTEEEIDKSLRILKGDIRLLINTYKAHKKKPKKKQLINATYNKLRREHKLGRIKAKIASHTAWGIISKILRIKE
jgi:hypothetical protein